MPDGNSSDEPTLSASENEPVKKPRRKPAPGAKAAEKKTAEKPAGASAKKPVAPREKSAAGTKPPSAAKPAAKRKAAAKKPGTIENGIAEAADSVRDSKPVKAARSTVEREAKQLPQSRSGMATLVGAAAVGIVGALAATIGRDATRRAATAVRKKLADAGDGRPTKEKPKSSS